MTRQKPFPGNRAVRKRHFRVSESLQGAREGQDVRQTSNNFGVECEVI